MCRLTIVLFFLNSGFLFAQEAGYETGYIVTLKKDTIHGLVKNINQVPYRVLEDIKFKTADGEKVQIFSPEKLYAYCRSEDMFLSKQFLDGTKAFVKVVHLGFLSLYSDFSAGLVSGPYGAQMSSSTSYYLQKANEPFLKSAAGNFKKQMLKYLGDAPKLCHDIENNVLKRKDLEEIVKLYNKETGH